jgi:divalent metal cation (Fe/Co/Zn/Cd) transporter
MSNRECLSVGLAPTAVPLSARTGRPVAVLPSAERNRLIRQAKLLAWGGNVWHLIEFAIAVGAGIAASSVALIAFGADSLIEAVAGVIIVWRFSAGRAESEAAEQRAQRLVAVSYFVLAAYVTVTACSALLTHERPGISAVGMALAAFTALTMPLLALAKRRVGRRLGSVATANEGMQNMICAYLSMALLMGLWLNAALSWWWADPVVALVVAVVAGREGVKGWRGEACGCCAPIVVAVPGDCDQECCR